MADVLHLELAVRMPWLVADGGSWWVASGKTRDGLEFHDTVLRCLPEAIVGPGMRQFEALPYGASAGLGFTVGAAEIERACEVFFVRAQQPLRAVEPSDQAVIDAALTDRGVG